MERLHGFVQHYDWGSTTQFTALRGESPAAEPEAELWYGAHPAGPSTLGAGDTTLLDHIEADPVGLLGQSVVDRFGARLPFLLKLLAAERPLSLQAHPSSEQARAGFAAEEAAGIPLDAPNRTFKDGHHKPELIHALTPFQALVGFRPIEQTRAFYEAIGFHHIFELLGTEEPKAIMEALLGAAALDAMDVTEVVLSLVHQCEWYTFTGAERWRAEAQLVGTLAGLFGADPGIAVASLLNLVRLEPGESLYLDSGELHSYVEGLGVEIMANSDNVLRGGLTSKHVHTSMLVETLDAEPVVPSVQRTGADGPLDTPAPEFSLTAWNDPDRRSVRGPAIVLAVDGVLTVEGLTESLEIAPTEACWVADGEIVDVSGTGRSFLATVGATTTLIDG